MFLFHFLHIWKFLVYRIPHVPMSNYLCYSDLIIIRFTTRIIIRVYKSVLYFMVSFSFQSVR